MSKPPPQARTLAIVVMVCALASTCAFAATVFVRSPQQRAAEAVPPPPSTLTATVEERELVDTIVLRGTVGSEFTATIAAPGPGIAGDLQERAEEMEAVLERAVDLTSR